MERERGSRSARGVIWGGLRREGARGSAYLEARRAREAMTSLGRRAIGGSNPRWTRGVVGAGVARVDGGGC